MNPFPRYLLGAALCATLCSTQSLAQPPIIPHSQWQSQPPVGYVADAIRRNEPPGGTLLFHDLSITVLGTSADSSHATHAEDVRLRLRASDAHDEREARDGDAFNWHGYHVAIVAIYGKGELGGGLVALEVATVASLPSVVASSLVAGGANIGFEFLSTSRASRCITREAPSRCVPVTIPWRSCADCSRGERTTGTGGTSPTTS